MAVPFATTTISVLRLPADLPEEDEDYRDPYDAQPAREAISTGVRAHISAPSGTERVAGGSQEVIDAKLACDPADLLHTDRVLDERTEIVYEVVWSLPRRGLGLDHTEAGLKLVEGLA